MKSSVEFTSMFDDLEKNLQELSSKKQVPLEEILTDNFIKSNTSLNTLDELLDLINISCQSDFENIDESELDNVIKKVSNYSSWDDFLSSAGIEYSKSKLNL